jgi:hypothetical protein
MSYVAYTQQQKKFIKYFEEGLEKYSKGELRLENYLSDVILPNFAVFASTLNDCITLTQNKYDELVLCTFLEDLLSLQILSNFLLLNEDTGIVDVVFYQCIIRILFDRYIYYQEVKHRINNKVVDKYIKDTLFMLNMAYKHFEKLSEQLSSDMLHVYLIREMLLTNKICV